MESILEALTSLQGETAQYSQGVQIWMKVMAMSFLVSFVFVYSKPAARWILLAFVLNVIGLIGGKVFFPEVSRTIIGTCVHLISWPAILFVIWKKPPVLEWSDTSSFGKMYVIWMCWASLLLSVSVILDVRTFITML